MIALSTQDVSLAYGTDVILKDISFAVNDGDRVGIIGVNGAGKTSLFRILAGVSEADSGAVYIQKGHTVGMLEQNPNLTALPGDVTCLEYMYTAFPELFATLVAMFIANEVLPIPGRAPTITKSPAPICTSIRSRPEKPVFVPVGSPLRSDLISRSLYTF